MAPTPSQSASAQGPGATPYERPDIDAGLLMDQLPIIPGWQRVAAYRKPASGGLPERATVHAHYRQGEHVVVLTIADAGASSAVFLLHFDGAPPTLTDEQDTTTFHRDGAEWASEQIFGEPLRFKVAPSFTYKLAMADDAFPLTPGLATQFSLLLPNAIRVSAGGPRDTDPTLVRQVFEAVDRQKLLQLAPSAPARP